MPTLKQEIEKILQANSGYGSMSDEHVATQILATIRKHLPEKRSRQLHSTPNNGELMEDFKMKAEIYKKNLVWRVRLVGKNNEVVMNSEAYFSKSNAQRALKAVKKELK